MQIIFSFRSGFKRATDEGSLPEIAQYSPFFLPLNVLLLPKDQTFIFYLLFYILVFNIFVLCAPNVCFNIYS